MDDDIRQPDPIVKMRLIDDDIDNNDIININNKNDNKSQEEILLENLELEEVDKLMMKQIIIESKKSNLQELIEKLNSLKIVINNSNNTSKYNKLLEYIELFINSDESLIMIDIETMDFIDFLCTKTSFSRYLNKNILKSIFYI